MPFFKRKFFLVNHLCVSVLFYLLFAQVHNSGAQYIQQSNRFKFTGTNLSTSNSIFTVNSALSKDGNTAIVGGTTEDTYGNAAWIYIRKDTGWIKQAKLVGTGTIGPPNQIGSVGISADGNTAIIGPNYESQGFWIFTRTNDIWDPTPVTLEGTGGFVYGTSAAISGDGNTIVIGSLSDSSYFGGAWIFVRSGKKWVQQGKKLFGTSETEPYKQGSSVAISHNGNTVVIGGTGDNIEIGAAWVFTRSGTTWTQQGSKLVGTGYSGKYPNQGSSVAISADGNTIAVGADLDAYTGADNYAGATWIFIKSGTTWIQQGAKLVGTGAVNGAMQGSSVSLSGDGNTLVTSGSTDNYNTGAAWIFTRTGTTWKQLGNKILGSDTVNTNKQGTSVSISADGNTIIMPGIIDLAQNSTASEYSGVSWIFEKLPKLSVSNFSYNPAGGVYPEDTITISYTLKNTDVVTSPHVYLQYYLSFDTILDKYDYHTDLYPLVDAGRLDPGATKNLNGKMLIPFTKVYQDYYVFIVRNVNNPEFVLDRSNIITRSVVKVGFPDYIIQNSKVTPSNLDQGSNINISYSIKNQGNISSILPVNVEYFISTDEEVDENDIALTPPLSAGLVGAGNTLNIAAKNYQIPFNIKAGNYYLLIAVNHDRVVKSVLPTHVESTPITINAASDLIVKSLTATNKVIYPGFSVGLKSAVYNQGGAGISTSNFFRYCLSIDTTFGLGDILLGDSITLNGVPPYDSIAIASRNYSIPVNTIPGNYYLLAIADVNNKIREVSETNNSKRIPIKVGAAIDLTGSNAIATPSNVSPGKNVSIQYTVNNAGDTAASGFYVQYFLSTNATFEPQDLSLGDSSAIAQVSAKGSVSVPSKTFAIPAGTSAGNYFILCIIDRGNKVNELNKNNNVFSIPLKIALLSDIVFTEYIATPTTIVPGSSSNITFTIGNTGGTDVAAGASISFYISTNNTYEISDLKIADSIHIGALAAGTSLALPAKNISIPASQAQGNYYLLLVADVENVFSESNENNNIVIIPIKLATLSDLTIISGMADPSILTPGATTTVSFVVKNLGGTAVPLGSSLRYFLSSNTSYESNDIELNKPITISSLDAGATFTPAAETLRVPESQAPGNYYILIISDLENGVSESNENNNVASIQIKISLPADLTISNGAAFPSSIVPGNNTSINCTINNIGGMDVSSGFSLNYYLSSNETYDASDILLKDTIHPELAAGESKIVPVKSLTIPGTLVPGSYYILIVADLENNKPESNNNNNTWSIPVILSSLADVIIQNLKITPSTVLPGANSSISCTVLNQGGSDIDDIFNIHYFLSSNTSLDASDIPLSDSIHIPKLGAGASYTVAARTVKIPLATDAGNYYILAVADKEKIVKESTINNNVSNALLTVGTFPDLVIENASVSPSSLLAGQSTNISCTSINLGGSGTTTSFAVRYYLSKDEIYDEKDAPIGNPILVSPLMAGGSTNLSPISYTLPEITSPGKYYILLVADVDSVILESNEKNNLKTIPITINALPELIILNSEITPATLFQGDSISIGCTISNSGAGASLAIARLQYFISADMSFDSTDFKLGASIPIASIASNNSIKINQIKYKIPETFTGSSYYILIFIDQENMIQESNEFNNIGIYPISIILLPDIAATSVKTNPSTIFQGDNCTISGTISNLADVAIDKPFNTQFYFSKDQKFDGSDIALGTVKTSLNLGKSTMSELTPFDYTIPNTTPSGTYYILLIADLNSNINELNELNNLAAVKITVGNPSLTDLAISSQIINPSIITPGDSIYIECKIKNIGQAKTQGSYSIQYFISKEVLYTNSAIPLGAPILLNDLAAQSTLDVKPFKYKIPKEIEPGNYNIILFVDVSNTINEANEENNYAAIPVRILSLPDLRISNSSLLSKTFYGGSSVSVNISVRNSGGSPIPINTGVQFFLSSDAVFSPSDIAISSILSINPLLVSESLDTSSTFVIPANLFSGNYYIIAYADKDNLLLEEDESNNFYYLPITLKPRPEISFPDNQVVTFNEGSSIDISASINSGIPLASVIFSYRKITDSTKTFSETLPIGINKYQVKIPTGIFDEIGIEYFFQATDSSGNISLPKEGAVYVNHKNPGLLIPYKNFGSKVGNYRIISVPLDLASRSIDSIFTKTLGTYNKAKWRIFNYRDSTNVEFLNGLQTLEAGKGYWIAIKEDNGKGLNSGEGVTVKVKAAKPFSVPLAKGWNQIGNPYNFDLSWSQIKELNKKNGDLVSWKKYEGEWTTGDTLHKMEGAFILASQPSTLYFPTQKKSSSSLRMASSDVPPLPDNDNWHIPISLHATDIKYSLCGFGMNKNAHNSKDELDELAPPRFTDWLELNFYHPEYFYPKFTRDIVASCDQYIWEFKIETSVSGIKTMRWENSSLKTNPKSLILLDIAEDRLVNMGKQNTYSYDSDKSRSFKIIYGSKDFIEDNLNLGTIHLEKPFPNPLTETTLISLSLPASADPYEVDLGIFNSIGKQVASISKGKFDSGLFEFTWDGKDAEGKRVPSGLYILQAQVNGGFHARSVNEKIIVR